MESLQIMPSEYGIEENKAIELIGNLPQIKSEREVLEKQYSEVVQMDIEEKETAKIAKELRLKISKNRTQGINIWHKNAKDFFLKGGQFVDAIKRVEVAVNERMEQQLEEIEKYAENKEKERLDLLESERLAKLELYKEFVPFGANIRNISEDDFDKLLNGSKLQFYAKIEAEKKTEAERLENERLAEEARVEREKEIEAQRLENERLKKEAEEKEKALELERKKAEAEKKAIEEKARKEAEQIEAKRQAELKIEREKQAKLESELKAKKDAEIKAEKERLEAEKLAKLEAEKLAKAPIKKQLNVWVDSFEIKQTSIEHAKTTEIIAKFESFKKWAKNEIENI